MWGIYSTKHDRWLRYCDVMITASSKDRLRFASQQQAGQWLLTFFETFNPQRSHEVRHWGLEARKWGRAHCK